MRVKPVAGAASVPVARAGMDVGSAVEMEAGCGEFVTGEHPASRIKISKREESVRFKGVFLSPLR